MDEYQGNNLNSGLVEALHSWKKEGKICRQERVSPPPCLTPDMISFRNGPTAESLKNSEI